MHGTTPQRQYVTLGTVKQRGWTPTLIKTVLGKPDSWAPNPHRRAGELMQLYDVERVERAEQDAAFQAHQRRRPRLVSQAKAQAQKRRGALLADVERLKITVDIRPLREIMNSAITEWNSQGVDRDGWTADPATHVRWCVNYIRHELTHYEDHISEVHGKIGVDAAVDLLRDKVLDQIAKNYPTLAAECERQKQ